MSATKLEPANAGGMQVSRNRGRFTKGTSGNPAGKLPGTRHRYTRIVEAMLESQAEELVAKAIELALAGDVTAIKVCLDRILPARRDRTVHFKIPVPRDGDAVRTFDRLLTGLARGELTPGEAAILAGVIEARCRTVEHVDLVRRIEILEGSLS